MGNNRRKRQYEEGEWEQDEPVAKRRKGAEPGNGTELNARSSSRSSSNSPRSSTARSQDNHRDQESIRNSATLGDSDDESGDNSAVSWVSKMSKIMSDKKREEEQKKKQRSEAQSELEMDNKPSTDSAAGQSSFVGMRVIHDMNDLGENEILTIRDTGVLDEGNDELESSNLVALEKAKKLQEKKKKKSKYDLYDEDGNSKGILSKYDEEEDEAKAQKERGFILSGQTTRELLSKNSKTAKKSAISSIDFEMEEANGVNEAWEFSAPKISTDFESAAPSTSKPTKKLRKRPRIMTSDEIKEEPLTIVATESTDIPASGKSILDDLGAVTTSHTSTRRDRLRRLEEEEQSLMAGRQRKLAAYQSALANAAVQSSAVFGQREEKNLREWTSSEPAVDMELEVLDQPSVEEQSRKPIASAADLIADRIRRIKEERSIKEESEFIEELQAAAASGVDLQDADANAAAEYSNTEILIKPEFEYEEEEQPLYLKTDHSKERNVRVKQEPRDDDTVREIGGPHSESAEMDGDGRNVANVKEQLKKSRPKKQGGLAQDDEQELTAVKSEESHVSDDAEADDIFNPAFDNKSPIGSNSHRGLGSTLSRIMHFGGPSDLQLISGRSKDERYQDTSGDGSVQIERKDKWGRNLTVKEAYREFCSQIAGRKPGKRKLEKRYAALKSQIQHQKSLTDTGVAESLKSVQSVQKKSKNPFVVLNSRNALKTNQEVHEMVLGESLKQPGAATVKSESVIR